MNEPIQYREYTIEETHIGFMYQHIEFTGAEDKRYGTAKTLDDAKSYIDDMTIEEQEHQITLLRKKVEELSLLLELERNATKNSSPF